MIKMSGFSLKNRTCDGTHKRAEHPSHHDGISDRDSQGAEQRYHAQEFPAFFAARFHGILVRPDRACPYQPPKCKLTGKTHPTEQRDKQEIGYQKSRPAVLPDAIREHPDIPILMAEPTDAIIKPSLLPNFPAEEGPLRFLSFDTQHTSVTPLNGRPDAPQHSGRLQRGDLENNPPSKDIYIIIFDFL